MTEFTDSMEIYPVINANPTLPPFAADSQVGLLKRYNSIGQGNHNIGVKAVPGGGPSALYLPFGSAILKTFSHQSKYIQGIRLNMGSNAGVGGGDLISFINCNQVMMTLQINSDGSLFVYANGSPGTVVCSTASFVITANTNCYVELVGVATDLGSDINIAAEVWVDNTMVASGNVNMGRNKNTLISQQADFNVVVYSSGVTTPGQAYMWDMYLVNGSGSTNTTRLGSSISPYGITSQPILPNSDTATIQWTPSSGSTHFDKINELPSDDGTSYNAATVSGKIDSLGWQPIPTFTGTVRSVQISYDAQSTDEGNCIIKGNIGAAGVEEQTASFGLCSSFKYQHQAFDLDPATGLAWITTNFDAKKFGYQLQ